MQYAVKLRCVVEKMVTCDNCSKEQARKEPFEHAIDEFESDQIDWQVVSVQEMP